MSAAPATSSPKKEALMTTEKPDLSKMTHAGLIRHEVAQHINLHHAELRSKALRLAIETIGTRTEDGAGIVTLAESYLGFLSAGQKVQVL